MRGHNPGVKPWLAWGWRLPGHEPPTVWAWPRSVHKTKKAFLTRHVGERTLDLRRLVPAVDAIIMSVGEVRARSVR